MTLLKSITHSQRHSQSAYQTHNERENQHLVNQLQQTQHALIESNDRIIAEQKQQLADKAEQERELILLRADKANYLSTLSSMQREKDWLWQEKTECQSELKKKDQLIEAQNQEIADLRQTVKQMTAEEARNRHFFITSEIIVSFSPSHFRVSGSTVTRIDSEGYASCFTKPVSKGIHRLSIKTDVPRVLIGVCEMAEHTKFLTEEGAYTSPKATMMYNNGSLYVARSANFQNNPVKKGEEWSAEADLEKRTLHFFINGVQQPHFTINIPVPLVFAIDVFNKDIPIEITFWGEEQQSHVTLQGTGHSL
ncbi:hypothetical protein BLNAU_23375 [Blattamonas nauphoetae]|uniref:SPRY domain-containing protein n=1 Tax=Blattamonas nauphoetae TaxID=2049346 RepID=A0ABQ9WQV8_9EUKA|nr:hypothetical protein BLNAU_23375 [Blattamonas nauphoetae]